MTARRRIVVFGAALMLAAACGPRPGAQAAEADGTSSTSTVDRAVAVARALRASPAATDSILAAYTLTRAEVDSLMYRIAADAALARTYAEAIR